MTQTELEYNKRCAEFLGYNTKEMKFHSDWNWIMEVVEAIQKISVKNYDEFCIKFYKDVSTGELTTYVSVGKGIDIKTQAIDPKQATIEAIDQFIILYNSIK